MLDDETYKAAAKLPFKERITFLMSETEFDEWANPSEERLRSLRSDPDTQQEADFPLQSQRVAHRRGRHSARQVLTLMLAAVVLAAGGAWALWP